MCKDSRLQHNRVSGGRLVNVSGMSILMARLGLRPVNKSLTIS